MKHKVKIDDSEKNKDNSFEVSEFEIVSSRRWLTKILVSFCGIIICIYFFYGIYNDELEILEKVINIIVIIMGFILGYYYDKQRKKE